MSHRFSGFEAIPVTQATACQQIHMYHFFKCSIKFEGKTVPLSKSQVGQLVYCDRELHPQK